VVSHIDARAIAPAVCTCGEVTKPEFARPAQPRIDTRAVEFLPGLYLAQVELAPWADGEIDAEEYLSRLDRALRDIDAVRVACRTHIGAGGSLPACVVPLGELSRRLKASKHRTCSLLLSDDGERLLINGGRVEHALQTYDPAGFPVAPSQLEGDSIEVDAAELVHAVKVTSHAVAKEPSRYAINGILLESKEKGSGFGDQLSALSFQPMVGCAPDAPIRGPHLNRASRDVHCVAAWLMPPWVLR